MTTIDTSYDRILDKLVKIQELIDHGATAGEISAATAKMQLLLSKHNLSIELVAMHKGEQRYAPKKFFQPTGKAQWRQQLVRNIAAANYGDHIRDWYMEEGIAVVCHTEDWGTIVYLYERFEPLLEKMAPIAYEQYRREAQADFDARHPDQDPSDRNRYYPHFTAKRPWCAAWRFGCAQGIGSALMQARREAEADIDGSKALVLLKTDAVHAAYDELFPERTTVYRTRPSGAGQTAGYATGVQMATGAHIAG
jgi:hypothetical protein